jgi:AcrR family transcriptional regulator
MTPRRRVEAASAPVATAAGERATDARTGDASAAAAASTATAPALSAGERTADARQAETRHKLIESAIDLFVNVGYHGLRISDITDYAGLGKGTFYLYFKDKRDLLLACFRSVMERVDASTAEYTAEDLDYFSRMARRMSSGIDPAGHWTTIDTFLRVFAGSTDDEIATAVHEVHKRMWERGKAEVTGAMQAGAIRDVEPALAGQTVAGMTEVLAWRLRRDEAFDAATILAFMKDIHLRILAPGSAETGICAQAAALAGNAERIGEAVNAVLPSRWPEEESNDTREKIIRAAVDLFLEVGYHNLRVGDLTDYAGVGKGTFYHHYASKQDLLMAYFRRVSGQVHTAEAAAAEVGLDHLERAAFRMRMWLIPETKWNRVVTFIRVQANSSDPEIAAAAWRAYRDMYEPVEKDFEEAKRQGLVRDLDSELAALALVGMQEVLAWRADQDATCDRATILAFMADVYCRAFLS